MARFQDVPYDLMLIICQHLKDSPTSLKALALARVDLKTVQCTLDVYQRQIDLTSGEASLVHKVLAHIMMKAKENLNEPLKIKIESTGDAFADEVIKYASRYNSIRLCLADKHGVRSPMVNQQDLQQCLALMTKLEPPGKHGSSFWSRKLKDGSIDAVLNLLLLVARNIRTLEMEGSLAWMTITGLEGKLQGLQILRLKGISTSPIHASCQKLLRLATLDTLEIWAMTVLSETVSSFGNGVPRTWQLPVTQLRLVDCRVTPDALSKLIEGCKSLVKFQYLMGQTYWPLRPSVRSFDLAQLLHDLSSNHGATLRYLEIRTLGFRMDNDCHYADELGNLPALQTLSIDYVMLHFDHQYDIPHWHSDGLCMSRRKFKKHLLTTFSPTPPNPIAVMFSLAQSLQRLELHRCNKTYATYALLHVMHDMKTNGRFPNLMTIKATFKARSSSSSEERKSYNSLMGMLGGRTRSGALREMAASVRAKPRVLHLET